MIKRIGYFILAFILIFALAACSTAGTSNNAASTQTASTQAASTQAASTQAASTQAPPTELTLVSLQGTNLNDVDLVIAEINKILREKINATVKMTTIPAANFSQQIKLMLTSKEKMDLFITGTLPFLDYSGQLANSQLTPLNDLLDKYGKDIKETLGDYLKAATVKGKVYAIPTYHDEAKPAGFIIRKDLVDKYKIDMSAIKSIQDVEPVLKILKENEKDMAPFTPCQATSTGLEVSLHIPYGDSLASDFYFTGVILDAKDPKGKVVNYYETQQCLDLYRLIRKWNLAGYVLPGVVTSQDSYQNLIKAGKVASGIQDYHPAAIGQTSRQTGMPTAIAPLSEPVSNTACVGSFMWAVPVHSTVADKAVQFMNLLFTDRALINLFDWGIEGKHYVKDPDGRVSYPDGVNATNVGYAGSGFLWGNQLLSYVSSAEPADLWQQMEKHNNSAIKSVALGFMFDATNVKTEYAACMNVWTQYQKALGCGAVDPDKVLPEFLSKLKAAGVDKIIAEKQKQYDEFLAGN